jgi:hypothetical protein
MRIMSAILASLFLTATAVTVAQAPKAAPKAAPAPKAPAAPQAAPAAAKRPIATKPAILAEVMRGILFPNANLLFDVQQRDPGAPPAKKATGETGGSTTETFANVYSGWQQVQAASASLDVVVDEILKPRTCTNGKPAPVANADYKKFAAGLRTVARQARAAAEKQDKAALEDITNDLSDACANCHEVYRDNGPAGSPQRCVAPAKKAAAAPAGKK